MTGQGLQQIFRSLFGFGDAGSARSLFFNRFWVWGAIGIAVLGAVLGDRALVLSGALILGLALATAQWNRLALTRTVVTSSVVPDRLFPGDRAVYILELVNAKPLPLPWLSIEIELSDGLMPVERETMPSGTAGRRLLNLQTHLGPYERVRWRIDMLAVTRGLHTIGPVTLRSSDPLGFFTSRAEVDTVCPVTVYPRLAADPAFHLPPRHLTGDVRVPRHMLLDPLRIVGVRDYHPEDPMKSIHWKATARQGALQVRIAEPTTTLNLAVFANLDTFDHYWEGLDVSASERVIELAASIAVWGIEYRYAVGLVSNGIAAGSDQPLRIASGRGARQRAALLEGLARVSPYSTTSFTRAIAAGLRGLPAGSTAVFVTAMLPEELEARIRSLIAAGHRVVLVPVAGCPQPAIRGLIVRHFGPEERDEELGTQHASA